MTEWKTDWGGEWMETIEGGLAGVEARGEREREDSRRLGTIPCGE